MSDSLTFRLLRYIKASAATLNFTRAADLVFVAQFSLSHQIGKFEDHINLLIFERSQNGLKLTPGGHIIAMYAEDTLQRWEKTLAMALALQRNEGPFYVWASLLLSTRSCLSDSERAMKECSRVVGFNC